MNPDILISLAPELALFALAVVVLLTGLATRARVVHVGQVPPFDGAQGAPSASRGASEAQPQPESANDVWRVGAGNA
jgi:hypothetical protein